MGRKHCGEKEKLLVMSNFSFSHNVFKRLVLQTCKNQGLFGKGLSAGETQEKYGYDIVSCCCDCTEFFRHWQFYFQTGRRFWVQSPLWNQLNFLHRFFVHFLNLISQMKGKKSNLTSLVACYPLPIGRGILWHCPASICTNFYLALCELNSSHDLLMDFNIIWHSYSIMNR